MNRLSKKFSFASQVSRFSYLKSWLSICDQDNCCYKEMYQELPEITRQTPIAAAIKELDNVGIYSGIALIVLKYCEPFISDSAKSYDTAINLLTKSHCSCERMILHKLHFENIDITIPLNININHKSFRIMDTKKQYDIENNTFSKLCNELRITNVPFKVVFYAFGDRYGSDILENEIYLMNADNDKNDKEFYDKYTELKEKFNKILLLDLLGIAANNVTEIINNVNNNQTKDLTKLKNQNKEITKCVDIVKSIQKYSIDFIDIADSVHKLESTLRKRIIIMQMKQK